MKSSEVINKFLIVTGTFNIEGGKSSHFGEVIYRIFSQHFSDSSGPTIDFINGGNVTDLNPIAESIKDYKIIFWMPHIDNMENPPIYGGGDFPINRFASVLKKLNPTAIFIQAKRNDNDKHTTSEIVIGMLKAHANLCFVLSRDPESGYSFKVLDPLGNIWYSGIDIEKATHSMAQFVGSIEPLTRVPSVNDPQHYSPQVPGDFLEIVRYYGSVFTTLINKEINKDRFLGNASTRCMHGFPSVRSNDIILVSKRNVDKEIISDNDFVPVWREVGEDILHYSGMAKPSVDAAIQVELYKYYQNVKYIIHGHVYVEGVPYTDKYIPCGYIEEADEIIKLVKDPLAFNFMVNLIGHGCIMLAKDIGFFKGIRLVARSFPEILYIYDGMLEK